MVLSLALALWALSVSAATIEPRVLFKDPTCQAIENAVSSASGVYYPGSLGYTKGNKHFMYSSSDLSLCTVEPGSVADVSKIIQILGNATTPFGIKGGGHASNPGFSSTSGVQIAMSRFRQVTYSNNAPTVDVGTGCIWDEVYAALEPYGVNVVGGRVSGVGMAGFTLGGGYSWLTNLHGLTIDTVTAFEIVIPGGQPLTVTEASYPDLFYGLKGGFNNFGIVTKITLKVFPQTQVWGGVILHPVTSWPAVTAALKTFNNGPNPDPNANVIQSYNALAGVGIGSLLVFYNAPTPPAGLFDDFLAIPYTSKDIKTRGFLDFVTSSPSNATAGQRGRFSSVSLASLTPTIIDKIVSEALLNGITNLLATGLFVSYAVEPFIPSAYSHGSSRSAWPHTKFLSPLNLYYSWPIDLIGIQDSLLVDAIRDSTEAIRQAARDEGQDIDSLPVYGNYAITEDGVAKVFKEELADLKVLRAKWDPQGVMLRAGGWKFI